MNFSKIFSKNSSPAKISLTLKGKCVDYIIKHLDKNFRESEYGQNLVSGTQEVEGDEDMLEYKKNGLNKQIIFFCLGKP